MDYPKHLSEKIREEVAVSYINHELKKIFPSIKAEEVKNLMKSRELYNPRDFWNGIHGVGMGFKLHIGFIYLVTAENIKWTKEKIKIEDLYFGIERENTQLVGSKLIKNLLDYYQKNQGAWNLAKKKLEENWIEDEQRDADPIIVTEKKDGLTIYEGNNRAEKFMFDGKTETEAYVGRYTTEVMRPSNYWLPTSLLMDNLYYVYQAIDDQNEELFEAQIKVLKNMLSFSESGKIEFTERALTSKKEYRKKILTTLEL